MQILLLAVVVNLASSYKIVENLAEVNQNGLSVLEILPTKTETVEVSHHDLHFIAIGDWGTGEEDQRDVSDAMGRKCEIGLHDTELANHHDKGKCDFILSLGDNIYPQGVTSANDTQFYKKWRDIYDHPSISELNW